MDRCLSIRDGPLASGVLTHNSQASAAADPIRECSGKGQGKEEIVGSGDQLRHISVSSGHSDENEKMVVAIAECVGQEQGKEVVPGSDGKQQHAFSSSGSTDENGEVIIPITECAGEERGRVEAPRSGDQPQRVPSSSDSTKSHQPHSRRQVAPVELDGQLSMKQDSTSHPTSEDLERLSVQLLDLFEQFGHLADLQQAIAILQELIKSTSTSEYQYCERSGSLGIALWYRFGRLGELQDLENAISMLRNAVNLTPRGHPDLPTYLNSLGNFLVARFDRLGELSDLEEAISTQRDAVDLTPRDHPHKSGCLSNLGKSLEARFRRLGELSDLEGAISAQRNAVDLTPRDHPHKPRFLNNLGISFRARFGRLGELSDLEGAISAQRDAVDLTPRDHPHRPHCLNNLGNSFKTRFQRLGELSDLEEAISAQRDAIDLTPHDHPDKPGFLINLGISLTTRFERLGELSDLEEAISAQRDAVGLTPRDHPHKPRYLSNLGISFNTRFERLEELHDIGEAISILVNAVDLTPCDHPEKPGYLNNLGGCFFARFQRLGELRDLEEGMSILRDAVALTPRDHPNKPGYLYNLGSSSFTRFMRLGELIDLEEAISTLRDAVELTPHDHPHRPGCLTIFGISLNTRFERLGELSDLQEAISAQEDAVTLTPHDHPHKPDRLTSLGISFNTRFDYSGELCDLEKAISAHRNAVDLAPRDHPAKPFHLDNLGISFVTRFEHFGELGDLEQAISILKDAVTLTPSGHPHKPIYLNNLGNSFHSRFECLGELSDLEEAVSTLTDAVNLTPHEHPDKPARLLNLGGLVASFGRPGCLEQAISLYSCAASSPVGPIDVRFRASQRWISCARHVRHHTLLRAYSVTLALLPQLAWIGHSLTHRYSELLGAADVVREAAAAALDESLPETAVEWLEQGRSIVWGELFQLRSSHEDLSSAHPDHARRLRELSTALEYASAAREKSLSALSERTQHTGHHTPAPLRQEIDQHRALAIERDRLLQEIRRLPGFNTFLLRKQFSHLRASAHSGAIIILNASETRCDALIVLADVDHVIHVPLPNFPLKRSADLQNILKGFVRHAREGIPVPHDGVSWDSILSPLWKSVVKPVLDAVALSIPGELSRIFWCPTGPLAFLPIHAAGIYDRQYSEPGHKVYDFVISSYIPTLSILLGSSHPETAPSSSSLRILAVRQPSSDGCGPLPGVHIELARIGDVVANSPSAFLTEPAVGTVEEVLALMKESDWVHFACHGIQDGADSGLCLADRRQLKLRDMTALSRSHGGLAFLSACQTATGEKDLSDEAIHMAAGMLFAGYAGVVGTMWSISDRLAPDVARAVYVRLLRDGKRPDYREAARALHEAIGDLRDRGVSFAEWVPFIHVGL